MVFCRPFYLRVRFSILRFIQLWWLGQVFDLHRRPAASCARRAETAPGLGRPLRRALPCVTVLSVSTDQSLYQIDNQKQNDRAECGGDNRTDYASAQS